MTRKTQYAKWNSGIRRRVASAALTLVVVLVSGVVTTHSAQAQTFKVLHRFAGPRDGSLPYSSLIRDEAGNLYGTTQYGGGTDCFGGLGCGTVYKLDPTGKETVLYRFTGTGGDGSGSLAGVIRDKAGNLYGTTGYGGLNSCPDGCGTVYKLDPTGKETVLYSFTGTGGMAIFPARR